MKTLLVAINAKYIHSNPAVYSLQKSCRQYSRQFGIELGEVLVQEYTINQSHESIYYRIVAENPDIVAFSVYIWNLEVVRRLAADLKAVRPELKVWMGGPEVSYGTEHKNLTFDVVMEGEGERVLFALLAREHGEQVPGSWQFTQEGRRASCAPIDNLNELPFLYDDLTPFQNRIIYYEASRGCPFHCAYCLSSAEKGVRELPLPRVIRELSILAGQRVSQVKLVDRTFNCHPARALALVEWLQDLPDDCPTNFHFEIEAGTLSEKLIEGLTALPRGRVQLEIGIQSTHKKTLRACGRSDQLEPVMANIRRLVEAGNMKIHVDLIAGLPYEDYRRFQQSFDDVYRLGAQQFQLGFLKLLTGTPMENMVAEHAFVFAEHPPYEILKNRYMSQDDLFRLKCVEDVLERLYNSGRFTRFLAALLPYFDGPFAMMASLARRAWQDGIIFQSLALLELFEWLASLPRSRRLQTALLLDYYTATSGDRVPARLKALAMEPADRKERAAALLRRLGRRQRKMVIRFAGGKEFGVDYTEKDPVTECFWLWNKEGQRC